jgi:hypothetical protein
MSPVLTRRIARGLAQAASRIGAPAEVFRPKGAARPLAGENRVGAVAAAFSPGRDLAAPRRHGQATWQGVFNPAWVAVGDYLRQGAAVYFIAALPGFGPALCVRANRIASLARPDAPLAIGAAPYGAAPRMSDILTDWPAAILGAGAGRAAETGLPGALPGGRWQVLLPVLPGGIAPRAGDVLRDDLGRRATLTGAEATDLGWRLGAVEITT